MGKRWPVLNKMLTESDAFPESGQSRKKAEYNLLDYDTAALSILLRRRKTDFLLAAQMALL